MAESASGTIGNFKNLKNEVRDLQNQLAGLDRGTKQYNETLNRLAQKQGQINSINRDIRNSTLNLTDVYREVSSVAGGVVSGFNALNAVSALVGKENEELAQTFVKLQAGMSIVQSITSLSAGFKSLDSVIKLVTVSSNALKVSLGALAIGGIILLITQLTGAFSSNKDQVDATTESYKIYNDLINQLEIDTEFYIQRLIAQGASEDVIYRKRVENNIELVNTTRRAIQEIIGSVSIAEELFQLYGTVSEIAFRTRLSQVVYFSDSVKDEIYSLFETYTKYQNNFTTLERINTLTLERLATQRRKNAQAAAKREREEAERNAAELELFWRNFYDTIEQNYKDSQRRTREEVSRTVVAIRSEWEDFLNEPIDFDFIDVPLFSDIIDFTSRDQINARRQAYEEEIENLAQVFYSATEGSVEYERALTRLRNAKKEYAIFSKTAAAAEIKLDDNQKKSKEALYANFASLLSTSSKLLGEATVAGKIAAVASTTISTYSAAQKAYESQMTLTPDAPVRAYIAMAAAIGIGLANVKSILSVKSPGASDSSGSAASVGAASLPSMPELSTPIQETHNNLNGYDEELYNQSVRVYVLESDVTGTQNRVAVAEAASGW